MNYIVYGAVAGFILLVLTVVGITRAFPPRVDPDTLDPEYLKGLPKRFHKWNVFFNAILMLSGVLMGLMLWAALPYLADAYGRRLPADAFLMLTRQYWMLPAGLLGLGVGGGLVLWLSRSTLHQEFHDYALYQSLMHGYDYVRVSCLFVFLLIALGVVSIFVGLNTHALLRGGELIVTEPLLNSEEHFPLSDIRSILTSLHYTSPSGHASEGRRYTVLFRHSETFNTTNPPLEDGQPQDAFMTMLSRLSRIPIQEMGYIDTRELQ